MVEYGLMVALIAVVCIAAVTLVGSSLSTLFGGVSTNVSNAGSLRPQRAEPGGGSSRHRRDQESSIRDQL